MLNLNWTTIIVSIITTIPVLITAITGMMILSRRIQVIHVATNSMKDALVASTKVASELKGHAQGVKDEQKRKKDK